MTWVFGVGLFAQSIALFATAVIYGRVRDLSREITELWAVVAKIRTAQARRELAVDELITAVKKGGAAPHAGGTAQNISNPSGNEET